jgi:hypothetical protein
MQRIINNMHWIELIMINLANIGVLTWIHYVPTLITSIVGLSIIILNGIKIYKELKK